MNEDGKSVKKRDVKLESKTVEESKSTSQKDVHYTEITVDSKIPYAEYYCTPDDVLEKIQKSGTAVVADVLTDDELKFARE